MLDMTYNHADYVKLTVSSVLGQTLTDPVSRSWRRCIDEYKLDPVRQPEVVVVDDSDLRARKERLADMLTISKSELMNLYEQIAGSGYAILIADVEGVVLDYVADPEFTNSFSKLGMCIGGLWGEPIQGTNAVGTCLIEKQPLVVHQKDHFLPRNIELTCAGAPIFNHQGEVLAVLDASGNYEVAQRHTLALVNTAARTIENRLFLNCFKDSTIVRFHSRPEFIGAVGEGEIALSHEGIVLGANRNALSQLGYNCHRDVVGKTIAEVFKTTHDGLIERSSQQGLGALIPIYESHRNKRYFATLRVPESINGGSGNVSTSAGRTNLKRREAPARQDVITREILLDELGLGDPRMALNVRYAKSVLDRDIPILIFGETGTGKEVMARAIHSSRDGDSRPFVAVNCASIPETLIESELFGYKPGAFTGASREGHKGKILQANKGTLFLDEIGDMPLSLQARLLRVLEEREVQPLGGNTPAKVDIALVSATHRNLTELVAAGRFRADLYYRLQGLTLSLPPLRERRDKRTLIKRMVELEGQRYVSVGDWNQGPFGIDEDAVRMLEEYDWPGNIRQLRTVIRVALALCVGSTITAEILPEEITNTKKHASGVSVKMHSDSDTAIHIANEPINAQEPEEITEGLNSVDMAERTALITELEKHRWNIAGLARRLKVSRLTVYRKMKRLNIQPRQQGHTE